MMNCVNLSIQSNCEEGAIREALDILIEGESYGGSQVNALMPACCCLKIVLFLILALSDEAHQPSNPAS
jgi:hypothetical protein